MGVKTNAQGVPLSNLKTALQYADDELGITVASSSYAEICDALADYFPDWDGMIYNAGVETIPIDVTGYLRTSSFSTALAPTKYASYLYVGVDFSGGTSNKALLTNTKVNVTRFNTLYFTLNGTTRSLDISSLSGEYYVYIGTYLVPNDRYWLEWGLSTTKGYFITNKVAGSSYGVGNDNFTQPLTKIWCE